MTIYLYVKTHQITGLKYLGQTQRKDPHRYTGSGVYWQIHLKKHGKHYDTVILCECQTKEELAVKGSYYSKLWNVVESKDWANLKEETGTGGRLSKETRAKISVSHKGKSKDYLKGGHWWNNGIEQYFGTTPPNFGYNQGRLSFNNVGSSLGADAQRGKLWINNGIDEFMIYPTSQIPTGYALGRTIGVRNKGLNIWAKGSRWWNNGSNTRMSPDCPGPDWVPGRLRLKRR